METESVSRPGAPLVAPFPYFGGKRRIAFSDGRTIDVTIPKGAQDGQTLRLKGQGGPGRGGAGDAFIEIAVQPHAIFRREGEDLVMDLPVAFYDAPGCA